MARIEIPYLHRRGGHCGSGALRDLTEWAQLGWGTETLSEGLVFTLGGAWTSRTSALRNCFPRSTW